MVSSELENLGRGKKLGTLASEILSQLNSNSAEWKILASNIFNFMWDVYRVSYETVLPNLKVEKIWVNLQQHMSSGVLGSKFEGLFTTFVCDEYTPGLLRVMLSRIMRLYMERLILLMNRPRLNAEESAQV